jgi:hypothetical protein
VVLQFLPAFGTEPEIYNFNLVFSVDQDVLQFYVAVADAVLVAVVDALHYLFEDAFGEGLGQFVGFSEQSCEGELSPVLHDE